jgi:quinoprotein glucose dehydrogenase
VRPSIVAGGLQARRLSASAKAPGSIMKPILAAAGLAAVVSVSATSAQNEWVYFGQDQGATKYSSLTQINTENVHTLQRAWTFNTGDASGFFESTPLVVDDVLYFASPQAGFFALDPVTGQQIWKYEATATTRRGVSYWRGDATSPSRIIASTGNRLVALHAKTGQPIPEFGQGGFVEMGGSMPSPPAIYRDLIITPGSRPVIRAWSARTGALVWTFNLIAQPGEPGHETWENEAWRTIGGTNVWGYLTVDAERGIVYAPNSIAGSDYVGVDRPGNNAYGTSLVAIDIATGKLRWYQQLVHHDIWDYDLGAAPTLIDVVQNGQRIPAVAQINKMGLLFIFDRTNGRPIFGIEERPVPQGTVPGEKTSATQPFPIKPAPLARNTMTKADLPTGITPEHTAFCANLWEKYQLEDSGPYTPWRLDKDIVLFPGAVGGGNWNGVSFNPNLGLIFTNIMNAGQWGHLEVVQPGTGRGGRSGRGRGGVRGEGPPAADPAEGQAPPAASAPAPQAPARAGGAGGRGAGAARGEGAAQVQAGPSYRKVTPEGGRFWNPQTRYTCANPPWGELVAVNANTGDIAWKVPLGLFEELEARGLKTGTHSLGGSITTAGNLVFIGATIDSRFRAFDARNGRELWTEKIEAPAHTIPSTYMGRDSKQYVVFTAGGGGFLGSPRADVVAAYRLP